MDTAICGDRTLSLITLSNRNDYFSFWSPAPLPWHLLHLAGFVSPSLKARIVSFISGVPVLSTEQRRCQQVSDERISQLIVNPKADLKCGPVTLTQA